MAVPSIIKSLDYFFVLRPMLFVPGWSTLLAGYLIASKQELYFTPSTFLHLNFLDIIVLLIIFSTAMGASFLLNQLMDIETDLKNKKLFILSENHISKNAAIIETIVLILMSLLFTLKFGIWLQAAVILFIIVTGYLYNYKPFVLKDRALGSLIANAAMGWLAFSIGWLAVRNISFQIFFDSLPYLFFNTALYFFTTLPDVPGDRKSNKKTLAVLHGLNAVIVLALISYLSAFASAIILNDYFALIFIICSLPFFIMVAFKKDVNSTIKTTKYAIFFFAIALCVKIPFYFIVLVGIFVFTKWYFLKRFQYNYPNFKGE